MDEQVLAATRRALHGVAELVIAGPQYRAHGTIKLRSTPGGFGGVLTEVRVEGTELVWAGGRAPLSGTCAELAAAAGLTAGPPGNYHDTSGVEPDEPLSVDAAAAELLAGCFARGDEAMRALAPEQEPVLWPEHFDVGISLDEVNYGSRRATLATSRRMPTSARVTRAPRASRISAELDVHRGLPHGHPVGPREPAGQPEPVEHALLPGRAGLLRYGDGRREITGRLPVVLEPGLVRTAGKCPSPAGS